MMSKCSLTSKTFYLKWFSVNILAIDFGERYIGLAVYTRKSNTSFALKVIDTKKTNLIEELSKIVENYEIDRIAIGNPIGLNNSETRMSKETDLFIKEVINENFNITVIKIDERMTSSIVTKSNNERVDDISALQILETYLSNV